MRRTIASLGHALKAAGSYFAGYLEWVWRFEAAKPYRRVLHDDATDATSGWTRSERRPGSSEDERQIDASEGR